MTVIGWEGNFRNMPDRQKNIAQEMLTDFLTDANLLCDGISVVGYDFDYLSDVDRGSITLIALPPHLNHIDLLLGIGISRGLSFIPHVKVRVMWHCGGLFPKEMGIPTKKRLEQAIKEFNDTGTVVTKMDNLSPRSAMALS